MNNSPERRVNGYVISQSKIHFQDRQSIVWCCCINEKNFLKIKKRLEAALKRSFPLLNSSYRGANSLQLSHPNGLTLNSFNEKHNAHEDEEERPEETKKGYPLSAIKLTHRSS